MIYYVKEKRRNCLIIANDNEFLGFRLLHAAIHTHADAIEIHARLEFGAGTGAQIPRVGIGCGRGRSVVDVLPEESARTIEHLDAHGACRAHKIVAHDEGGAGRGGILRRAHVQVGGLQTPHHIKRQRFRSGIVQLVPGAELQRVLTGLQFRNAVPGGTRGMRTEVVAEVVVEVIGHGRAAVDDELQVVTD